VTGLRNFASHGVVVVGTPVLGGGPGDPANRQKMLDGLDWIIEQNEVAGIYQGNLWVDHAVSMGTNDPIGLPLQQQTDDMSEVQTFLATLTNAGHGYIEQNGGGEQQPAIVAWMRYWIYGDTGAEHYFYGDDGVMCMPLWENPQRKNWE